MADNWKTFHVWKSGKIPDAPSTDKKDETKWGYSTHYYKGKGDSKDNFYVRFQYDADTSDPEYVRCRVIGVPTSGKSWKYAGYIYIHFGGYLSDEYGGLNDDGFCRKEYWMGKAGDIRYKDNYWLYSTNTLLVYDPKATRAAHYVGKGYGPSAGGHTITDFYLKKRFFDDLFTIPSFYICDQGTAGTEREFNPDLFDIYYPTGANNYGIRKSYRTLVSLGEAPWYDGWTPGKFADVYNFSGTVEDNKNNGARVTVKVPANRYSGSNKFVNKVTSVTSKLKCGGTEFKNSLNSSQISSLPSYDKHYLQWTYDVSLSETELKNASKSLAINGAAAVTPTVADIPYTEDAPKSYNASITPEFTKFTWYDEPNAPTVKPTIVAYMDENLTIPLSKINDSSWIKVSWNRSSPSNSDSPVIGCRFYLWVRKKGSTSWTPIGKQLGSLNGKYVDLMYYLLANGDPVGSCGMTVNASNKIRRYVTPPSSNSCYAIIKASDLGLTDGDSIRVWIEHWHHHKDIDGDDVWKVNHVPSTGVDSSKYSTGVVTVGASGSVLVKVRNIWTSGYVYVYDNGWKESIEVYAHDGNGWNDSL